MRQEYLESTFLIDEIRIVKLSRFNHYLDQMEHSTNKKMPTKTKIDVCSRQATIHVSHTNTKQGKCSVRILEVGFT